MKPEIPKRIRAQLRDLAAIAHEREVGKLLSPLADSFASWRAGTVNVWELAETMQAVQPAMRQLADRYNTNSLLDMNVACAIVNGLLSEKEVSADVLAALEKQIAFYKLG